jgi:hypothetical protein
MLTVYLDESIEQDDGHAIVAGFMGNKVAWGQCVRSWRRVLRKYGRESLHLADMRLRESHRAMLKELGDIPGRCKLRLIFGSVNVGSYKPSVAGTISEVISEGYLFAMEIAVLSALHHVPEGQRLEVICEQQTVYANQRECMLTAIQMMPELKDKRGISKLAKWSSIQKSSIIEPADYAAYAILQWLREPDGEKYALCSPILDYKKKAGQCLSGKRTQKIIDEILQEVPGALDPLADKEAKRAYRRGLPKPDEFKEQLRDFLKNTEPAK